MIDGWGIPSAESPRDGDAIAAAKTPIMDAFSESATGFCELMASSLAVGLPEGLMGNSEVGHLNIGAGRVVWQDVVRIDQTIKTGEFANNELLKGLFERAKAGTGRLHLCGLVSHGGVHSKQTHLYALLRAAKDYGVPRVLIHFFGDGRDTDPKSGAGYMQELVDTMKEIGVGEIATVVGRYYAMDRDKRWERVEIALKALYQGEGEASEDPVQSVKDVYAKKDGSKNGDEFLTPIVVGGADTRIKGMSNHDLVRFRCPVRHGCEAHRFYLQMMTPYFSSTTDRTVSGKSRSFSAMLTGILYPICPTPRTLSSPP